VLPDFTLVLATIITALTNFMNLGDEDMSEVQGSGDVFDETAGVKDEDAAAPAATLETRDGQGLMKVLRAFQLLKQEFDEKFKVIWS
jgi:hypothetical protein